MKLWSIMGDWSADIKIMKERTIKVKYERECDFYAFMYVLKSIGGVDVLEVKHDNKT